MILRGGDILPIADFYNPEARRRARPPDVAPIARYPKERHQGEVLLVVQASWRIGRWDAAIGAWLGQRGEHYNPTHFAPMPEETIEIDDA